MEISVLRNNELSRFEIYSDSQLAGFADFQISGKVMAFSHTQVDPQFGGRGLGSKLIGFALDQVILEQFEVAPHCTFISAYIKKIAKNIFIWFQYQIELSSIYRPL